jgi:hypothetical protein
MLNLETDCWRKEHIHIAWGSTTFARTSAKSTRQNAAVHRSRIDRDLVVLWSPFRHPGQAPMRLCPVLSVSADSWGPPGPPSHSRKSRYGCRSATRYRGASLQEMIGLPLPRSIHQPLFGLLPSCRTVGILRDGRCVTTLRTNRLHCCLVNGQREKVGKNV